MKIFDSTKREHYQLLTTQAYMDEWEKSKSISKESRKHYKHKPYEYDLGGSSNDKNK